MAGVGTSGGKADGPGRGGTLALLLPGLVLFVLFLLPSESALTSGPALLIDNLLRTLAVIALAAAVVVALAERAVAARAAVLVSALCVLVGVSVLFSGLWTPFRDWWAMAGAAVAAAAAALSLYRLRLVWSGVKGAAYKVVGAVLTTAAVPVFSFWSETSFLPSRNAASVELTTQAVVQQDGRGSDHWIITSKIHNRSPIRAFVIISGLKACRWSDEESWRVVTPPPPDVGDMNCERLVAPFTDGSWLAPDATLTVSTPARIDGERPLLEVRLRVAYARADRVIEKLDSSRNATAAELGACATARVTDIQPQSRLAAVARRELAMMYADVDGDTGRTYFFGAADHMRCVPKPDDQRLNETRFQRLNQYFSLTEATTVWAGWPAGSRAAGGGTPPG